MRMKVLIALALFNSLIRFIYTTSVSAIVLLLIVYIAALYSLFLSLPGGRGKGHFSDQYFSTMS